MPFFMPRLGLAEDSKTKSDLHVSEGRKAKKKSCEGKKRTAVGPNCRAVGVFASDWR